MSRKFKISNPGHPPTPQDDSRRLPQRDSVNEFFVLGEPETRDAERHRATWDREKGLKYQSIRCAINRGHGRAGARITPLSVILPDIDPLDFVWTPFECMVQDPVVQLFREEGFTGFQFDSVSAKFKGSERRPPALWELRATGFAGLISRNSGYEVARICPDCGMIDDASKILDPTKVVDTSRWDGSDFFRIEPISGWIFVTGRVVRALRTSPFRGWKAYSLIEWKESFDIAVPGPSPEQRARNN